MHLSISATALVLPALMVGTGAALVSFQILESLERTPKRSLEERFGKH
jgi:hypothetical protein